MISGNKLKQLGKRLRDGTQDRRDLDLLSDYRRECDELLVEKSATVSEGMRLERVAAVIAGRSKRTKSIIRKLQRPENSGMDLSRMDDLVGIRVIVNGLEDQDRAIDLVTKSGEVKRKRDYRDQSQLYRSVHVVLQEGRTLLEVQIRTLPQQLWADESESFGEKVKDGGEDVPEDKGRYLRKLSVGCYDADQSGTPTEDGTDSVIMTARAPFSAKLPDLERRFERVTSSPSGGSEGKSYIIVFDSVSKTLSRKMEYGPTERDKALLDYHNRFRALDDTRFDIVVLNSPTLDALSVTHPRFFSGIA